MKSDIWYFAYGSNLFRDRMHERTGPIRKSLPAVLNGYLLAFNKSGKDGEIYANIVPHKVATVLVVVYLCNYEAMDRLDAWEGVSGGHYRREPVQVKTIAGDFLIAHTYIAGKEFVVAEGRPSPWYLDLILNGAAEHDLPAEYIRNVETIANGNNPGAPTN